MWKCSGFLAAGAKPFVWLTFGENENQIVSANTEGLQKMSSKKGLFVSFPNL